MADNTMFGDLLAAQKEMPALQKSAINPHFKNKYVPLEELLTTVVPILNKHNLVLLQQPVISDGHPALRYCLLHVSGEVIEGTMPLLCAKDDPQGQGSAITYARRYSLMALLGLSADIDDDAEKATRPTLAADSGPRGGVERPTPAAARKPSARPASEANIPAPVHCGQTMKFWKAETTRNGKAVGARYKCMVEGCDGGNGWPASVWADKWADEVSQQAQLASAPVDPGHLVDPDELPYE